jgi:hypothetical protein
MGRLAAAQASGGISLVNGHGADKQIDLVVAQKVFMRSIMADWVGVNAPDNGR